jgi:hypothetical protein
MRVPMAVGGERFTPESANAILPEVLERLLKLRDSFALLAGHHERVRTLAGLDGGERGAEEWLRATREVAAQLRWLFQKGIVLRDIEQGLIDFPSVREGREVFLCWRFGEDTVGFWHEIDTGFQGRKPLD